MHNSYPFIALYELHHRQPVHLFFTDIRYKKESAAPSSNQMTGSALLFSFLFYPALRIGPEQADRPGLFVLRPKLFIIDLPLRQIRFDVV